VLVWAGPAAGDPGAVDDEVEEGWLTAAASWREDSELENGGFRDG
jgi:hypothetical protein